MRVVEQTDIARPPEAVFRWIEDPVLAQQWQPEIASYRIVGTEPGMVGTRFEETLQDARGRMTLRGRVTAYAPGEEMAFDLRGRGVRVEARYSLSRSGAGTRLRAQVDARFGGCLSVVLALFARRKLAQQLRRELRTLKVLCEREA